LLEQRRAELTAKALKSGVLMTSQSIRGIALEAVSRVAGHWWDLLMLCSASATAEHCLAKLEAELLLPTLAEQESIISELSNMPHGYKPASSQGGFAAVLESIRLKPRVIESPPFYIQ
jgi:hypothetical protein